MSGRSVEPTGADAGSSFVSRIPLIAANLVQTGSATPERVFFAGFKNTVTEVVKKSQKCFPLSFQRNGENLGGRKGLPPTGFNRPPCYVQVARKNKAGGNRKQPAGRISRLFHFGGTLWAN
jgi:hypothetical protein